MCSLHVLTPLFHVSCVTWAGNRPPPPQSFCCSERTVVFLQTRKDVAAFQVRGKPNKNAFEIIIAQQVECETLALLKMSDSWARWTATCREGTCSGDLRVGHSFPPHLKNTLSFSLLTSAPWCWGACSVADTAHGWPPLGGWWNGDPLGGS